MSQLIPFPLVLIMTTTADALVAAFWLFRAYVRAGREGAPDFGLRRILPAAGLTAAWVALKLAVFHRLGTSDFGLVHMLYVDLTVLLPSIGLALLLTERIAAAPSRRLTAPARILALASLGAVLVGIYATWIEPFRLRVESAQLPVPAGREGKEPLRIGVISDLQTTRVTDYERGAIERLMAQRPDVIVLPGDIFQGTGEQLQATLPDLKELFERLSAPGGVYLVLGDTDGPGAHLEAALRDSRVRVLVNEVVQRTVRDRRVTIGGVELKATSRQAQSVVERLENAEGEDDVRILVSHRPDVALGLRPRSRIDLVIAGHTHGGQVVVPGYGPPLTLTEVPRTIAAGGLHRLAGNAIYVSRGVGCERGEAPRIRFLCPPEISLIELGAGQGTLLSRPTSRAGTIATAAREGG